MTRVALVGAGAIATTHLTALARTPGVEVVAVVDLSPARAEATAERHGVPRWFADTERMLDEVGPDVVHVTTPPHAHLPVASAALSAGAHVLVEKPVASTYAEWAQLRDQAAGLGLVLLENQNYRFAREVLQVQRMVEDGSLGQVHQVDVRFFQSITRPGHPFADTHVPHPAQRLPGGPITDFLPHMASLVHAFLGPHTSARADWLPGEPGSPTPFVDMTATVRTDQGAATLSFSGRSAPDGFWVLVQGEHGQARINLYEGRLTVDTVRPGPSPLQPVANAVAEARGTTRAAVRSLWGKLTSGPGSYEGLETLLHSFYEALHTGAPPPLSLQDVDDTSRLVDALTAQAGEPA